MKLNPLLYTKLIRPKLSIKLYTEKIIKERFNFNNSYILDFGCGTGSNCYIFNSNKYLGVDTDPERILYAKRIFPQYKFDILKKLYL